MLPLTMAQKNLWLISAYVPAAAIGQPVYLAATIDNVNPQPVRLVAVTSVCLQRIRRKPAETISIRPHHGDGVAAARLLASAA